MTKFSEVIIGKIKGEHIAPVPRWHFLLKRDVFWSVLAISLLLGSLSFSVIAHILSMGDLDIFSHLQGSIFTSAVMLLPYFWILSLIIFAFVAFYNWKHTKLGYRFKRRWIFVSSVALSMLLGSFLYVIGMGKEVDSLMVKSMPFYGLSKSKARNELWLQPESGLLTGKVVNIDSQSNEFTIKDALGKDWSVDENAVLPSAQATIKKGKIVKIIGKKKGENVFIALEIRKCGDCQAEEDADMSVGVNVQK